MVLVCLEAGVETSDMISDILMVHDYADQGLHTQMWASIGIVTFSTLFQV